MKTARQIAGNGPSCDERHHPRGQVAITVPIRTVPGLNAREHWAVRAKRVKRERNAVHLAIVADGSARRAIIDARGTPVTVVLTRVGQRKCDSDNLQGALKAIRDEIANWLQVDDGNEDLVRWEYAQERGPWSVRIEIREADNAMRD